MNGASELLIKILKPANYDLWCKADTWTIQRGVLLLLGVEDFPENKKILSIPSMAAFWDIVTIAKSSVLTGNLPTFPPREKPLVPEFFSNEDGHKTSVLPKEFIMWARSKGYEIQPQLELIGSVAQAEQLTNAITKPAYLDENNPMFSRELSIAIDAWEQVLSSNPSKPKTGSRKALILKWLEVNHRELDKSQKERIAVMINPDGNGGTPKTPAS